MRWAELIVCDLCDDYVVSDSFWQKSAYSSKSQWGVLVFKSGKKEKKE